MNRREPARWTLRYAAHLGLRQPDAPLFLASAGSPDPVEQIRFVAEIGFAGVFDNFLKLRPAAEQRRIGEALARYGVAMGSFVNSVQHWNAPLWGSTSPEARAQIELEVQGSIEAAQRVQGRHVTVTSGRSADVPLHEQHLAMIDNLLRVADRAARGGIVLMLEATNEDFLPGMLVVRAADALAIVEAVAHPAVRIVFDVAHVQATEGAVLPSLERCWPQVAVLQVADQPGRIDLGAGIIDWQAVLGFVRRHRYPGLVEIEHLPRGTGLDGEQALLARLAALDATL